MNLTNIYLTYLPELDNKATKCIEDYIDDDIIKSANYKDNKVALVQYLKSNIDNITLLQYNNFKASIY